MIFGSAWHFQTSMECSQEVITVRELPWGQWECVKRDSGSTGTWFNKSHSCSNLDQKVRHLLAIKGHEQVPKNPFLKTRNCTFWHRFSPCSLKAEFLITLSWNSLNLRSIPRNQNLGSRKLKKNTWALSLSCDMVAWYWAYSEKRISGYIRIHGRTHWIAFPFTP